jgi:hypothetical protein
VWLAGGWQQDLVRLGGVAAAADSSPLLTATRILSLNGTSRRQSREKSPSRL